MIFLLLSSADPASVITGGSAQRGISSQQVFAHVVEVKEAEGGGGGGAEEGGLTEL